MLITNMSKTNHIFAQCNHSDRINHMFDIHSSSMYLIIESKALF